MRKKIVDEPEDLAGRDRFNEGRGEAEFGEIEDVVDDFLLGVTDGNEGDLVGMVEDRIGQRDPGRRRLGRVVQPGHPGRIFLQ
jgi:hypothetical protein